MAITLPLCRYSPLVPSFSLSPACTPASISEIRVRYISLPRIHLLHHLPIHFHSALEEAIVDICIVNHPKDAIPFDDNYELLLKPEQADEGTGEGGKLQLAKHCYICFRRRKHNKTPSYITEVKLVRKGQEPLPEGFELIEKTVGGTSADLGKGGSQQVYLAVRRALVDEAAFRFSTPPMLADLCLCSDKKGCAAPMDYTVLPRVLNKLGLPAEDIYLAFRHGPSAGLCDIPYEAHSLEWFPHEETYEDFPLPMNELPMFCFPRGVVLRHQKRDDTPMPSYFSFVFTSIDGDRVHVACLQFYELLPDRVLRALEAKQRILTVVGSFSPHSGPAGSAGGSPGVGGEWDHDEESVTSSGDEEEEEAVLATGARGADGTGTQKAHHHKHHHRRGSTTPAGQVPSSPSGAEGGACKLLPHGDMVALGSTSSVSSTTLRTTTSSGRSAYGLFAPKCICIISHWPFYRALRSFLQQIYRISLSPSSVPLERYIAYFTHYMPLPPPGQHALNLHLDLGLNDRVENSSLTPITLQLPDARSLPLMDLDYEAPFRCLSLDNVLKIFTLLLMEERLLFISSSTSLLTEVTETILTLLFPFEWMSCYIPRLPNKLTEILDAPGSFLIGIYTEGSTDSWVLPQLSDPLFVVDLDRNCIVDAEGKLDYVAAMENLPLLETLREKLRVELERTAVTVKSAEALRERDSAFELPAVPGLELEDGATNKPKLNPDVVRDAFLVFVCELLGNYTRFFNSQEGKGGSADGGAGGDMTHNGVFGAFDVPGFVASVDKTAKPLLDKMVLTQMFAALVQQRTDHSHGVDRLVFFETCVQELKERKDAEAAAAAAAASGSGGGGVGGAGAGGVAAGRRRLDDRSVSVKAAPLRAPDPASGPPLLIHQAVASMVRREQLLLQQQQQQLQQAQQTQLQLHEALVVPASSSSGSTPINSPSPKHYQSSTGFFIDTLPSTIIVPGPSAEGCVGPSTSDAGPDASGASSNQLSVVTLPPQPQSFSYTQFPILLNKEWMALPPSSLPPILLEIMSRRKKFLKKGNRMILARSVSECMKDWQAVGTQIGGARNKEIYLAMQIFGIYFMCLPSRVSYKGRPLRIIMQAMGILQFILDFQLERYMDEAMWRSLLVACGRCGHASTRKIAIAIFGIMRRSGLTINALTYGQYTKALAEKDATEFTATAATTAAGGDAVAVVGGSASEASSALSNGRVEIDDSPWLEERGRAWYMATCEPSSPETLKSWTVADGFKNLLARTTKAATDSKKPGDRPALQDGHAWTGELRDPKLSAHNTTVSSITLDSAGVIGMWVVCLCVNCEYMPLDEEIMTLRQDLLLVQAVDDHANHLLLCPKCETPLMPRLYYDIKTFQDGVAACGARASSPSKQSHQHQHDPATPVLPPNSSTSSVFPAAEKLPQTQAAAPIPAQGSGEGSAVVAGTTDPAAEVAKALEAVVLTVSEAAASAHSASVSFSIPTPGLDASLSTSVDSKSAGLHLRGEVSGLGLGTTGGDHVDYMSPFTLRMRLEKLLLEHGEECLTRDWAREHQPELYWNLAWFTTRLSIPFPFLLDSLDPVLADAAVANFPTPKSERKKKKAQAAAAAAAKANPTATLRSLLSRGMSRQDSMVRLGQLFFHEVVVVGWEGEVVRNRCEKVEAMLKQRSFTPRAPPTKSSSNVGAGSSATATGAGVLPTFPSFASSASSTMTLGETWRQQLIGGGPAASTTAESSDAIGPLTVEQMFPNISAQELEAINEVRKTLLAKGCPGLKEAISQFFSLKHKQGGWTSEATLGSPYRVFLKLAANFHVKKLHNVAPITNLMANPGLEHEYTTAVMKLGDRFMRDKVGKDERQLLAELPKRDAIKFRSVFGHLY